MNTAQSPYTGTYASPTGLGMALSERGKTDPVYWDSFLNTWVVLQRHDVLAAMRDTNTFSNSAYRFATCPRCWMMRPTRSAIEGSFAQSAAGIRAMQHPAQVVSERSSGNTDGNCRCPAAS